MTTWADAEWHCGAQNAWGCFWSSGIQSILSSQLIYTLCPENTCMCACIKDVSKLFSGFLCAELVYQCNNEFFTTENLDWAYSMAARQKHCFRLDTSEGLHTIILISTSEPQNMHPDALIWFPPSADYLVLICIWLFTIRMVKMVSKLPGNLNINFFRTASKIKSWITWAAFCAFMLPLPVLLSSIVLRHTFHWHQWEWVWHKVGMGGQHTLVCHAYNLLNNLNIFIVLFLSLFSPIFFLPSHLTASWDMLQKMPELSLMKLCWGRNNNQVFISYSSCLVYLTSHHRNHLSQ